MHRLDRGRPARMRPRRKPSEHRRLPRLHHGRCNAPGGSGVNGSMPRRTTRLTLIHNDGAGSARLGRAELVELLGRAGYEVEYFAAKRSKLAVILDRPTDLV